MNLIPGVPTAEAYLLQIQKVDTNAKKLLGKPVENNMGMEYLTPKLEPTSTFQFKQTEMELIKPELQESLTNSNAQPTTKKTSITIRDALSANNVIQLQKTSAATTTTPVNEPIKLTNSNAMQYNQQPKQIITLPKNQNLISNPNVQVAPVSNPQIIVLKNQNFTMTDQAQQQSQQQQQQQAISSQRIVTPGQTSSTSAPQPVGFLSQMKPAPQQNPTILKLVSTKINKMPQILNISSQPFNSNLLKTSMRPVTATATSASTTSQPNPSSFIIKNNNPTQMITSNNKPNQIVHLSKINTSNCFLLSVII